MDTHADLTIRRHDDGRIEVLDPPPVGTETTFSLGLLAMATNDGGTGEGIGLDADGNLVVAGQVTYRPVRFIHAGGDLGPLDLVCERVA